MFSKKPNLSNTYALCKNLLYGQIKPPNDIKDKDPHAKWEVPQAHHRNNLSNDQNWVPLETAELNNKTSYSAQLNQTFCLLCWVFVLLSFDGGHIPWWYKTIMTFLMSCVYTRRWEDTLLVHLHCQAFVKIQYQSIKQLSE